MAGILIKSIVSMIICIFVMFIVIFGMGFVVDNFLYVTAQFPMTQGGIGQALLPTNMRMFNWFYLLPAFLIVVVVVWVIKILFFQNQYDGEEVMNIKQRRL
jgi:hypothetical protein